MVRGGKSESYLERSGTGVCFQGTLDIETLGGAGFASQRTVGDDLHWNLSAFGGLELSVDWSQSDDKVYTLILKDVLLPRNHIDGREQTTVSWEYNFSKSKCRPGSDDGSSTAASMFIPWDHFEPTYRGKPSNDSRSLDLSDIKRFSIMTRSFFGAQQGKFHLHILSITASSSPELPQPSPTVASHQSEPGGVSTNATPSGDERREGDPSGLTSIPGGGSGGKL
ncbi:hypothetical protein H2200_008803 [Cladophialophora chaetospira]|uniref:NADH:ubiquinone oxidoreductase intermediate-associated protein 30 domain-containing protein n=1 Tax=Cladophialophora chaetospira TaxID=386627 RepID=A0AA38X4Q3_9EURO|nr:hypothetical protein H2200_008803 [Cladophialophora chaetospira]